MFYLGDGIKDVIRKKKKKLDFMLLRLLGGKEEWRR